MPIGEIGAFLLVLVIVFICGELWLRFIEALLQQTKKLFTRHQKSSAWHPLPPDKEDQNV